ncbi:unnamed protein product [Bursaphelenchus xylophilus]|nr:unnamed protein product [Bursaphelenchus xylophilus]CAG9090162.1 unnamed protein product [Bursaphelenchus xylophilus]
MDVEVCVLSERFRNSRIILADEIFCTILYVLLLILLVYLGVGGKCSLKTFHFNFRLILYNVWLIILIQAVWGVASNVYFIFIKFYFTGFCSNTHVAWQCALIKWPLLWTVPAMSFVHLVGFVERTWATRFPRNYENTGRFCGVFWMIITWLVILGVNIKAFDIPDYQAYSAYCMVTVPANQNSIQNLMHFLLALDVVVTAGDLLVLWLNKSRKRASIYDNYSLSRSFQQHENYITSRLVLPVSLTHSVFFMLYLAATSICRYFCGYGGDPVPFVAGLMFIHNILIMAFASCLLVFIVCWKLMEKEKGLQDMLGAFGVLFVLANDAARSAAEESLYGEVVFGNSFC